MSKPFIQSKEYPPPNKAGAWYWFKPSTCSRWRPGFCKRYPIDGFCLAVGWSEYYVKSSLKHTWGPEITPPS